MSAPRVAIAVPVGDQASLRPDERISWRHLTRHLGRYDRFLIAPPGSALRLPGCRTLQFPGRYFGSPQAHTRLLLSRRFYEAFAGYEFLLLYHLDALVFRDELGDWCERGYDYIGAPWLVSRTDPERGFSRGHNGGFSLRRIEAFLRVLDSSVPCEDLEAYPAWRFLRGRCPARWRSSARYAFRRLRVRHGVRWHAGRWRRNEDGFWSRWGPHYAPGFAAAPPADALRFAFECAPRFCFERNGSRLPFGCHAWPTYDRAFWEPFLLPASEDRRPVEAVL